MEPATLLNTKITRQIWRSTSFFDELKQTVNILEIQVILISMEKLNNRLSNEKYDSVEIWSLQIHDPMFANYVQ